MRLYFPELRHIKQLVVLTMMFATGCATKYGPRGYTGGYEDRRLDETTFMVAFTGNGYTSRQTVEASLFRRCAEVTTQAGYDYFMMVDAGTERDVTSAMIAPGHSSSSTMGSYSATTYGNMTHGRFNAYTNTRHYPAQYMTFNKFGANAMIKVGSGAKPDSPNAFNAREVLKYAGKE